MAEELKQQIDSLTAELEAQRLQIERLLNRQSTSSNASLSPSNARETTGRNDVPRVPDAIKFIVPYKGDKKTLASWLTSVEEKLKYAKQTCSSEEEIAHAMPLLVSIIRDKIVGEASEALVARHTALEWSEIKTVLSEYFGDKRDLCTLVTQISYMKQGTKSITEFYNDCRELLSDITAKLLLDQETKLCVKILSKSYEDMILNSFIDGLVEPYSTLTRTSRPTTLLMAYQGALDQYNAAQRRKEKFYKPPIVSQKPINRPSPPTANWQNYNRYPPVGQQIQRPFMQNAFRPTFPYIENTQFPSNQMNATFNNRPQIQNSHNQNAPQRMLALPNIKQDPSGHRTQGNKNFSSQQYRTPFPKVQNLNIQEEIQTKPEEYEEQVQPEQEMSEQNEVYESSLNFLSGLETLEEE